MFDVILHQPQIPPNTGNVIRLCANAGARLHLVAPLGFDLDDRQLRRAGLDYHEYAPLRVHDSLDAAVAAVAPARLFALSTRNSVRYDQPRYAAGDAFLFGSETSGLPVPVLAAGAVIHAVGSNHGERGAQDVVDMVCRDSLRTCKTRNDGAATDVRLDCEGFASAFDQREAVPGEIEVRRGRAGTFRSQLSVREVIEGNRLAV